MQVTGGQREHPRPPPGGHAASAPVRSRGVQHDQDHAHDPAPAIGPVLLLRIAFLAVASMMWPLLLVIVVIALRSERPLRVLMAFYVAGFLTASAVGTLFVFGLESSTLMTGPALPSADWFDAVLGSAAIAVGVACRTAHRRRLERQAAPRGGRSRRSRGKQLIERLVARGGAPVFAAGVIACIVPSPLVVLAMADVAQLGYSVFVTMVVIVAFFLITFAFIEVPIGGFMVSPAAAERSSLRLTTWLDHNLLLLAAWALLIGGASQLVIGLVGIVA